MAKEILRLSALSKFYTGKQSVVVALNEVNLSFSRGEFVAITGESGSGKSTLSHVLGGILPYENGEMFFAGNPTSHFDSADWERYRRDNISFISQNYGILPGATVMENVVSALLLTGMSRNEAHEAAEALLRRVELWDMHKRRAAKLSSGQKQRLSIARALAKPAPILIADEPTGNLDSENSAKVIELLAQAAEDRLVILITHEFSEAAAYATRHIILQDGRVVMDAPLQPPREVAAFERREAAREKVGLYVAHLQQRSRPIWSTLLTIFFALTAFAVFAFLGTLIVNIDDTSTRIYDSSVFKNGSKDRIIVATQDGSSFTDEQLQMLADLKYVLRVEPNGYVVDSQYGYREGVDYDVITREEITDGLHDDGTIGFAQSVKLRSGAPYIQTVPVLPSGQEFLSAGRLPESMYEVVAVGDESMLGTELNVYLNNATYWPSGYYQTFVMTVVGVTDVGEGLYFHDDLARFWKHITYSTLDYYKFLPDDSIADGQFIATSSTLSSMVYKYRENIKKMYRSGDLLPAVSRDKIVFENINASDDFALEGEDVQESITLTAKHGTSSYYQLTNLATYYYLTFDEKVNKDAITPYFQFNYNYATPASLRLYPIGETTSVDGGDLREGDYLIIAQMTGKGGQTEYFALSTGTQEGGSTLHLYATQINMDASGEPIGYDTSNIWTFKQVQSSIYTITSYDGRKLATTPRVWAGTAATATDFSYYWAVDQGYTFTDAATFIRAKAAENKDTLYASTVLNSYVYVSASDFDKLTLHGGSDQVSLTIRDYAYTDRVIDAVQALGFAAASPYQLGSVQRNETLVQQREQTLLVCILALVAVIALQLILLRTLFLTQMESYRLLSNIGLSARMAKRSIFWQVLIFCLLGQVLSIAALAVCNYKGVERIANIVRYLPPALMALLIVVHLAISMLAALLIMRALRKNVYASTKIDMDLPMDETETEVQL